MKMKGKKTIILVTHQISYLYGCDEVLIMEDGRISVHDSPNNLI
jgi:ABC-type multidrug transport system ATPase subunit